MLSKISPFFKSLKTPTIPNGSRNIKMHTKAKPKLAYFLGKGNRVAIGFVSDLFPWFNLDVSYVRQADKGTRGLDIFFVQGVVQLKRKGIE